MKRIYFIRTFIFLSLYPFIIYSYWWINVWINTDQMLLFSKIIFAPYLLPYRFLMSDESFINIVSIKSQRYLLTSLLIALHLLLFYLVHKLYKKRFPLSREKEKALYDLGFYQKGKNLETDNKAVKIDLLRAPVINNNKKELTIKTPRFDLGLDQVKNMKEPIEIMFDCEFTNIQSSSSDKFKIFTFTKNLFDSMNANLVPKIPAFNIYCGLNSNADQITLQLENDFSMYIGAKSGRGKTTLIKNYIRILKAVTPTLKVVIFDAKLLDYDDDFIQEYNIQFFPMNTLEQLQSANIFFDNLFSLAAKNAEALKENKVSHAERLHGKDLTLPLERHCLILDEGGRYLKATGEKEIKEEKKKLINHVTNALAMLRAHSVSIIVSTQRMDADELDIPYSNFSSLLLSSVSKEMSDKYADGFARDNKIGQWYLRNDNFTGLIKVPYKIST